MVVAVARRPRRQRHQGETLAHSPPHRRGSHATHRRLACATGASYCFQNAVEAAHVIMMVIIAPPQDTTHPSADAGDFASSSAMVAGPWGVEFTNAKRPGVRLVE